MSGDVVEGCPSGMTKWRSLTWLENEPAGTAVRLRVRFANTIAALQTAIWYGPFDAPLPPTDLRALMVPTTKYAQVEVQLSTTIANKTPTFSGYTLAFDGCSAPIN